MTHPAPKKGKSKSGKRARRPKAASAASAGTAAWYAELEPRPSMQASIERGILQECAIAEQQ